MSSPGQPEPAPAVPPNLSNGRVGPVSQADADLLGAAAQIRASSSRLVEILDAVRPWSRDDVWQGAKADRFVEDLLGHRKRLVALEASLCDAAHRVEQRSIWFVDPEPLFGSNPLLPGGSLGG